ncbi:hypothetical protein LX32DRAFT_110540 [Colletotrichum zoysiae]|uniref:Uncharacterized protein n=1 Tax=Colletotrichum zoysiae TaxID=1216348 RepID=A0AAD9LXB8_9PEZI|nr:hypothetical protein LX32DRAFT_110540 [Colletotrichum zoysiae]
MLKDRPEQSPGGCHRYVAPNRVRVEKRPASYVGMRRDILTSGGHLNRHVSSPLLATRSEWQKCSCLAYHFRAEDPAPKEQRYQTIRVAGHTECGTSCSSGLWPLDWQLYSKGKAVLSAAATEQCDDPPEALRQVYQIPEEGEVNERMGGCHAGYMGKHE